MMAAFNVNRTSERAHDSDMVECTPVGAPGDGGDHCDVREKDAILFGAIQSIMHLTEWQSVQLELELHLRQKQHRALTQQ